MKNKKALRLLEKYRAGTCTEEEKAIVETWYLQLGDEEPKVSAEELRHIREETWQRLNIRQTVRSRLWYRYAAVVGAVLLTASAWLYVDHRQAATLAEESAVQWEDNAAPGGNRATLALGDGRVIALDDLNEGPIVEIDGMRIVKTGDGEVRYEQAPTRGHSSGNVIFHKITTPRGGQYRVVLPDGSRVSLNAASSLKYPARFDERSRQVTLTGEGYFEVTKQTSSFGERISFSVTTSRQRVEVLGTRFNVDCYDDEETVSTTLLEGRVRVYADSQGKSGDNRLLLHPDQQALLTGDDLELRDVHAEDIIAWTEGFFRFERADIQTVMRQLSRWYDLDVTYEGPVPGGTFTGKVDRTLTLAEVLDILAYTRVKFRIENKKIIIFS